MAFALALALALAVALALALALALAFAFAFVFAFAFAFALAFALALAFAFTVLLFAICTGLVEDPSRKPSAGDASQLVPPLALFWTSQPDEVRKVVSTVGIRAFVHLSICLFEHLSI